MGASIAFMIHTRHAISNRFLIKKCIQTVQTIQSNKETISLGDALSKMLSKNIQSRTTSLHFHSPANGVAYGSY